MSQRKPENEYERRHPPTPKRAKHAVVMVLGDIGRSPRMQYHALSLLEEGHYVTLIGYGGESLVPPLESALVNDGPTLKPLHHGRLHVLRMAPYQPPRTNVFYRLLYYPLRLLSLLYCVTSSLWIKLNRVPHTAIPVDVILVQNPPSVPTLLLAYVYCVWRGLWKNHRPRMVIDWHNLGYTMFERDLNSSSHRLLLQKAIRTVAEWYERKMAPLADAHLTVTHAMEVWLGENFDVHGKCVRVLYDKPPLMFRPTTVEEQHALFNRLNLDIEESDGQKSSTRKVDLLACQTEENTMFTQLICASDGTTSVQLRNDRPALLVSSTSWTPDEDFSILLKSLKRLHEKILLQIINNGGTNVPKIVVIVTGKGPQKAHYLPLLEEFNASSHQHIEIHTLWLEAADYPKLLGCATLGISLHTSTSGLDLPMKVLDMFGCQVPVCAIKFDCLEELVKDGVNGRIFGNEEELANQLYDLLDGYPMNEKTMERLGMYRRNICGVKRWKENWEECARHLIVGDWND